MNAHTQKTTKLGEMVAAAFDKAACYSSDPQEVSRLAACVVAHLLGRTQRRMLTPLS